MSSLAPLGPALWRPARLFTSGVFCDHLPLAATAAFSFNRRPAPEARGSAPPSGGGAVGRRWQIPGAHSPGTGTGTGHPARAKAPALALVPARAKALALALVRVARAKGTAPAAATPTNPLNNPYQMNPYTSRAPSCPAFPTNASDNQQFMYALASGTGGFVIANTNDLLGGPGEDRP